MAKDKKPGTVSIDQDVEDKDHQLPPHPEPLPPQHPSFIHCMPPKNPAITKNKHSVFLAGSIEMGNAVQWQPHMVKRLHHLPITVCNPRRGHWNTSIIPAKDDMDFKTQVEWELKALDDVTVVCFFFDHNTRSPVTMLELGLLAEKHKVVVCCDKRFWKSGNIHIVCGKYGIPYCETFEGLVGLIMKELKKNDLDVDENGKLLSEPSSAD
ncbi:hypothetical protein BDV95DRAFT_632805 [Massariosphaeria phaeospora]|uniref:Uncharacterized protein n=1 Tax=Massariosphaeria phaeospora TaxID=100035 RepID=A0A7C8M3H7_9PLEO|nr:hypothetical protein BDV95DRAFT_632805 [Massariosphaeria phaeospora]